MQIRSSLAYSDASGRIFVVCIAAEIKSVERMRGQRALKIAARPLESRLRVSLVARTKREREERRKELEAKEKERWKETKGRSFTRERKTELVRSLCPKELD